MGRRQTSRCTRRRPHYGFSEFNVSPAAAAGEHVHYPALGRTMADDIVELDFGVRPEAAVSGAVCLQTEAGTFLTFNAMRPTDRMSPHGTPYLEDAGTAVVEFKRCLVSRFGYPNDEARWGIPQYKDVSYGIYEVKDSTWIKEVVRLNRYRFPETKDDYVRRHFLFAFHDGTFECLADDLTLQVVNEPYQVIFERLRRRALGADAG